MSNQEISTRSFTNESSNQIKLFPFTRPLISFHPFFFTGRAADVEVGREGDVSMEPPNESFLGNVSAADKSGVEFGDEGRREMFGDDFMEFREEV